MTATPYSLSLDALLSSLPQRDMEIREAISTMLKTPTGMSLLDSGGTPKYDANGNYTGSTHGYGRAWERNQGRDFDSERHASVEIWARGDDDGIDDLDDISYSLNTYHFLVERLQFLPEVNALFTYFCETTDPDNDKHWPQLMEEFPEWLGNEFGEEWTGGFYGDGGEPITVNTYNHDSAVDQTLQYTMFDTERWGTVYLLQIHQGADVRGGYTRPWAFTDSGMHSEYSLTDDARGDLWCTNKDCRASWYTDDAYHWYGNDGDTPDLKEIKIRVLDDFDAKMTLAMARSVLANVQPGDLPQQAYYSELDRVVTCPVCHNGFITA